MKGRRPKAHQHYRVSTPGGFRLGTNFHRRDLGTRRFRWKGRRKTSCFGQTTRKTSQCRHSVCYLFRLCCFCLRATLNCKHTLEFGLCVDYSPNLYRLLTVIMVPVLGLLRNQLNLAKKCHDHAIATVFLCASFHTCNAPLCGRSRALARYKLAKYSRSASCKSWNRFLKG